MCHRADPLSGANRGFFVHGNYSGFIFRELVATDGAEFSFISPLVGSVIDHGTCWKRVFSYFINMGCCVFL